MFCVILKRDFEFTLNEDIISLLSNNLFAMNKKIDLDTILFTILFFYFDEKNHLKAPFDFEVV